MSEENLSIQLSLLVDKYVHKFMKEIIKREKWTEKELMEKWNECSYSDTTKKKKTGYQKFFIEKRTSLKNQHPELSFGEISKEISKIWRNLTDEEKTKYDDNYSSKTLSNELRMEDLALLKMSELKQLCEERKMKRTGNKTELIQLLLNHQTSPDQIKQQQQQKVMKDSISILEDDDASSVTKRSYIDDTKADEDELDYEEEDLFDDEDS